MALFKKIISAVKKLFRKGKSRPFSRLRPKRAKKIKRAGKVKNKPSAKQRAPKAKKLLRPKSARTKKISVKKAVAKSFPKKPVRPAAPEPKGVLTGEVTHYFSKIMVCVVKITRASLSVGDHIRIQGNGAAFTQKVVSLQIESQDVRVAPKGQLVGLKVAQPAKPGDKVFKL